MRPGPKPVISGQGSRACRRPSKRIPTYAYDPASPVRAARALCGIDQPESPGAAFPTTGTRCPVMGLETPESAAVRFLQVLASEQNRASGAGWHRH
jgi:hypothetical protein